MTAVLDFDSIGNAYYELTGGQRSMDWILLGYINGTHNVIGLLAKGDGGIMQLKRNLTEEVVAFGYLKIIDETKDNAQFNPDYIHMTFIGSRVKPQQRARAVIHRLDIHQEFPNFLLELECNCLEDVTEDRLFEELAAMKKLLED